MASRREQTVRTSAVSPNGFQADEHPSLSVMIYNWLHAAILSGTLAPGQLLRQEELAAQFKTSRVPLREALQSLQAEGLVVLRPRRGYAVTSLDGEQLLGVLQLRILMEGYAGYAGTLRRSQADVRATGTILADMERLPEKLTREAHRLRWAALNRQFHFSIFSPSGNEHLLQACANITAKIDPYVTMETTMLAEQEASREDHRRIYEAFAAGDADQVGLLSRRHCERLALRFVEMLRKRGALADIPAARITDLGPAVAMLPSVKAAPEARVRRAAKG